MMLPFLCTFQDCKEDIVIQSFNSDNHICRQIFVKMSFGQGCISCGKWGIGRLEGKGKGDKKVYQGFYVSLHFQDQCREVRNEAEDGKFRQSGRSLASLAGISAVSLSPEPREDLLKPSLRKPPNQEGKKPCSLPLSHILGPVW